MWIEDQDGAWHNSDQIERLEVVKTDDFSAIIVATYGNGYSKPLFKFNSCNIYLAKHDAESKLREIMRSICTEKYLMYKDGKII